jgi:hypothetical protein
LIIPIELARKHRLNDSSHVIVQETPQEILIRKQQHIQRTAVDNDGILDKEATSYNDIFDAFILALKFYHFEDSSNERYGWCLR